MSHKVSVNMDLTIGVGMIRLGKSLDLPHNAILYQVLVREDILNSLLSHLYATSHEITKCGRKSIE